VLILGFWSVGYKLDYQPMYLWDESRQANNALEMAESGNFLYPTYEGQPDFWNTKPHLLVAIQAALFRIFEPNLLWLRLPSAMAGTLVLLLWFRFLWRRQQKSAAWIFLLIMLSCRGFNVYHISRTGDYDALLLLFLTGCIINLHKILIDGHSQKLTWRFSACFTMAVLTKSLAALLWGPVFLVAILIFSGEPARLIRSLVKPALLCLGIIGAYYFIREWSTPGYLSAVFENEITGRYLAPNEGHVSEWYYYFSELYTHYFEGFIFFILLVPVTFLVYKKAEKEHQYYLLLSVLFLAIISISATRIYWYMAPVIPLLSVLVSTSMGKLAKRTGKQLIFSYLLTGMLIAVVFWQQKILWKENLTVSGVYPQYVLQQAEKHGKMPYRGIWLWENYCPLENYYSGVFKRKKIEFTHTNKFRFNATDTVYLYNYNFTDTLHKYYQCRQLHAPDPALPMWVFTIDGKNSVSE
jgi:4-amino-4-deoxy-L-arabinose transferase-like glycosyltransferase